MQFNGGGMDLGMGMAGMNQGIGMNTGVNPMMQGMMMGNGNMNPGMMMSKLMSGSVMVTPLTVLSLKLVISPEQLSASMVSAAASVSEMISPLPPVSNELSIEKAIRR